MKQLQRSRTDRVLFGVCGGFGEYLGIDADVVRIVWILLGVTGVGLIPYVVGIFLMPEATAGEEGPRADRLPRNVGLAMIAIAAFLVFEFLGIGTFGRGLLAFWSWRFFLPALLVVGGVLLVWPGTRELVGFGSRRKLRRSVDDRVLAGVCGGLAREFGIDANLVRMGTVLLVFLTSGIAAIAYVLLILVLPEETVPAASSSPAAPPPPPSPSGSGAAPEPSEEPDPGEESAGEEPTGEEPAEAGQETREPRR